jgi:anti-sigma regulatory factor (Ser/Thr protein kinase)
MLIEISDPSQVGDARRKAVTLAEDLGMDESRRGAIALATTEMATNVIKHAGRGHILVQPLRQNANFGVRVISVDKGPGISDISKAFDDGHSTAGTMGTGLGAIRRKSDVFDLFSVPGCGTVIAGEFWQSKPRGPSNGSLDIGYVSEPIRGEEVCGDGWAARNFPQSVVLMVVDGSGHGILAAEAAREAERVFSSAKQDSVADFVRDTHDALKKTRGAAMAAARVNTEKGLVSFAGVGNISASIIEQGTSRSLASHNGTLGQQMSHLQEFNYPWNPHSVLVMHSDGLNTRWDLDRYPGLISKQPSVIAAVLHRDFNRGRDDSTVVVAKAA